ncbi:MAG TPA: 50S ribosomal protein L9 [Candidatus Hydrogenedentes bacterium]|nr:50S ribosomal protein L9 [Candidatus Hydrogenedentota bacterium]HPG67807.1 50S ribosomal protein L9 [Candidatus Hydrogenedentota bacterium]
MKVILSQDVENVGRAGQNVKVADGYARNYLIPRKMAVGVDSSSAKQIEHERGIIQRREERRRAELTKVAQSLEAVTLEFKMHGAAEDKIFGSVTSAQIAERLHEAGHEVDRKAIHLEEPIKELGIFLVPIRLATGIEAQIKVWVSSLEEPQAPVTETADAVAVEPQAPEETT